MAWPPVLSSGIRAGIRQVPVSEFLPGGYVAGTTDIAPAVQAAADAITGEDRGALLMPPGTHLWNSSVYLNSAEREMTYSLFGHGLGTYIQFGTGLNTVGTYAIYVNQDVSGNRVIASPGIPRLHMAGMSLDGVSTARTISVIKSNMATVLMENLKCMTLYRLVQATDYCDGMTFRRIRWQTGGVPGAVMYYNHSNGDGLLLDQIAASDDAVVTDLANCNSGMVLNSVVGRYFFQNCSGIEVHSAHNDGGDDISGYQALSSFQINNSRVSIHGGWDQIGTIAPLLEIADTGTIGYSDVLISGWEFGFRTHTADKVRAPHIKITSAVDQTTLRVRNCYATSVPENVSNRFPSGPKFTATDTNIQAAYDAYPTALLEDVDLVQTDMGWQFIAPPPLSGRNFRRLATAPTINAATATTLSPGNFTAGTQFYKIAVYTDKTRALHTTATAEASVAITGTQSALLDTFLQTSPALVRIWRGTTTGTYTRYVDLPVSSFRAKLVDTGTALNGFAWITTGIPTPPTTNTTMDGIVVGRDARFEAAAAPIEGAWAVSDRVYSSAPVAGGTEGWVCVTAGSPGTWKTFGSIAP